MANLYQGLRNAVASWWGPKAGTDQGKMRLAWEGNQSTSRWQDTKSQAELAQGTIAACLRAVARERSVLKFLVKENGDENGTRAKRLTKILNHPNPISSRVDFLELLSQHHDQNGNGIILMIPDDSGFPAELYVMPSFFVDVVFESNSSVIPAAYYWQDLRITIPAERLIFIKNTSFKTGPYKGRGVVTDDELAARTYNAIAESQRNYFLNGGLSHAHVECPPGSFWTTEQIHDFQTAYRSKFNPQNGASDVPILQDGAKLVVTGPGELDFVKSKAELRDAIRESFQVPKILLGDTDNVNHNNGQTAIAVAERILVLRFGEKMASALEHKFNCLYPYADFSVEVDPTIMQSFTQLDQATKESQSEAPAGAQIENARG